MTRTVMWALLGVVAASAAVLSFSSLRSLAVQCGYPTSLAALFPLTVDCGAAAACLTWLGGQANVTTVGRTLTWCLLVASVGMNGITHYLDAYGMRPAWWLLVAVSAIPPSVLGAVVHLAVLLGREKGEHTVHPLASPADSAPEDVPAPPVRAGNPSPKPSILPQGSDRTVAETKARALLASNPGMGRRALMAGSGLSEYEARKLLEQSRAPRNGVKVLEEAK